MKEQICDELKKKTDFILGDVKTYIWVKSSVSYKYSEYAGKYHLGGGNFLIVQGLFSIINYLCKINFILQKGTSAYDIVTKESNYDEKSAFEVLIRKSNIWKINDQGTLQAIWDYYRNSLTHLSYPKKSVSALNSRKNCRYLRLLEDIRSLNQKPFIIENGIIKDCLAELLFRDVEKLIEWLCNEIKSTRYPDDHIEVMKQWMKDKDDLENKNFQ
ncbi:MAG: hypothetical protein PHW73_15185 [Atribacterota bacterium]|nr:hypothetical protein [Atribacterota bacterium]